MYIYSIGSIQMRHSSKSEFWENQLKLFMANSFNNMFFITNIPISFIYQIRHTEK